MSSSQNFCHPLNGKSSLSGTSVISLDISLDFSFYLSSLPLVSRYFSDPPSKYVKNLTTSHPSPATPLILGTTVSYVVYYNSIPDGLSAFTLGLHQSVFNTAASLSQSVSLFCLEPSSGFPISLQNKSQCTCKDLPGAACFGPRCLSNTLGGQMHSSIQMLFWILERDYGKYIV